MQRQPKKEGEETPLTCQRCNNRLAFGLARIEIERMSKGLSGELWICGTCADEFQKHWMTVYKKRSGQVDY